MDPKIQHFLDTLRLELKELPPDEIQELIVYYQEYLCDAQEAGKDLDELLKGLDSPAEIAINVTAELQITLAQRNPKITHYNRAMRNIFRGATSPIAFIGRSLFLAFSYSLVLLFMASALLSFAFALAGLAVCLYEAFQINSSFILEKLGIAGLGLLTFGLSWLLGYMLFKLGRQFIRFSAVTVGRMTKRGRSPMAKAPQEAESKPVRRRILIYQVACIALGFLLFSLSGLPIRFFTIFNSMKPEKMQVISQEYNTGDITKISIVSAQSCIRVERAEDGQDKIVIRYEQPDWMQYQLQADGSMLSFYESSNGRLPFFRLVCLHESRTQVTVTLPKDYDPKEILLETMGGFITIDSVDAAIKAKTYTGILEAEVSDLAKSPNLKVGTETGIITVGGDIAGQRTTTGLEYFNDRGAIHSIELTSSRGNISIK